MLFRSQPTGRRQVTAFTNANLQGAELGGVNLAMCETAGAVLN